MRKVLLISSLRLAAAAACAEDGEGICKDTGGAALLQFRTWRTAQKDPIEDDAERMPEPKASQATSISGLIAADRFKKHELALSMIRGSDVCQSCNACLFAGQCYDHDPKGNVATEEVCSKYDGIWCPSGAGKNVTPAIPPCESEGDFNAEAVGHQYCDFKGKIPDETTCTTSGCHLHRDGNGTAEMCDCETESQCQKLGGTFTSATCGQMLAQCGPKCEAFKDAQDKGACDGITMKGSGEPLDHVVMSLGKSCCRSFPQTLCNLEGTVVTPCVEDSDFVGTTVMTHECKLGGKSSEECTSAGCFYDPAGSMCYCLMDSEASCEQAEGAYTPHTCGDAATHWEAVMGAIQTAKETGTCPAEQKSQIESFAETCCKTAPKSVCNPTAEEWDTPCMKNSDFDASTVMTHECKVGGMSSESCAAGGCFWDPSGEMCYCIMDSEASCQEANGAYTPHTCGDAAAHWEAVMKAIKRAKKQKKGECSPAYKSQIESFAGSCCKTAPMTCN